MGKLTNTINPFALVAAGSIILVMLALHLTRRAMRNRAAGELEPHGWEGRGFGARRTRKRKEVGEVPVLVDVWVEKMRSEEKDGAGWDWEDVMPLTAKLLPLPGTVPEPEPMYPRRPEDIPTLTRPNFPSLPRFLRPSKPILAAARTAKPSRISSLGNSSRASFAEQREMEVTMTITMPSPLHPNHKFKDLDDSDEEDGEVEEELDYVLGVATMPVVGLGNEEELR